MKQSGRPTKTASRLAEPVRQHLNMYALAASAAGVGVLALTQPAEAKIKYTPAHKNIGPMTFLDLNHDGRHDFEFISSRTTHCVGVCTTTPGFRHATAFASTNAKLAVYGARAGNQIYGQGKYASALPAGVSVGPKGKFPGGNIMAEANAINSSNEYYKGPWAGVIGSGGIKHHYLGLKFTIHGQTHFGWARIDVTMSKAAHIQATLTGYAYETIPNKAIITGKTKGPDEVASTVTADSVLHKTLSPRPAALGLLAMGSSGLSIWRREESVSKSN